MEMKDWELSRGTHWDSCLSFNLYVKDLVSTEGLSFPCTKRAEENFCPDPSKMMSITESLESSSPILRSKVRNWL